MASTGVWPGSTAVTWLSYHPRGAVTVSYSPAESGSGSVGAGIVISMLHVNNALLFLVLLSYCCEQRCQDMAREASTSSTEILVKS